MAVRTTRRALLALATGLVVAHAMPLESAAEDGVTIKLGWATTDADTDVYAYAARAFKQSLEEAKPGHFTVQLYPNRQLGDEKEMVQGLQLGTVDAALITNSIVANVVPQFQINDLPFLYASSEDAHQTLDGPKGDMLFDLLAEKNIVGLAFCESGFRNMINNKRPVTQPADVEGVKYRVMESPIFIGMFDNLGGSAVPMAWGDVFTAVQQGAIDGLEVPTWVIDGAKLYEVTEYLSLTQHVYTATPFLISKRVFDKLSADDQALVRDAARSACSAERAFAETQEQALIAKLKEKGMAVNQVADPAAFQKKMQPLYNEYRPKIGSDFMDAWMAN